MATSHRPLRVQKPKQLFCIVLAQRGADAHVAHNGAGNPGREAFRSIVAAGAVLLEDPVAFVFMLLRRVGACSRLLSCRRSGWVILCGGLREPWRHNQDRESEEKMFRSHNYFPFQAGKRKR
jgi:hypothetical protein